MKKILIPLILIVILLIICIGFWQIKEKQKIKPQNNSSDTNVINVNEIQWEQKSFEIQTKAEYIRNPSFKLTFNIPDTWDIQIEKKKVDSNCMIKDYSQYSFISEDSSMQLILESICTGWSAKYSDWPLNSVNILERRQNGNGASTLYRVRYMDSNNIYKYIDGTIEIGKTFDKTKDKVMDVIMISYHSPYDQENDFYFLVSNLRAEYKELPSNEKVYLEIADKIAASLALEEL